MFQWIIKFHGEEEADFLKDGCDSHIYDDSFCLQVCALQQGEECSLSPKIGENMCQDNLECVENGEKFTCEIMEESVNIIIITKTLKSVIN